MTYKLQIKTTTVLQTIHQIIKMREKGLRFATVYLEDGGIVVKQLERDRFEELMLVFLGSRRTGLANDECRKLTAVDAAAVEADGPGLDGESPAGPMPIHDVLRALAPGPGLRVARRGLVALPHRLVPILVPRLASVPFFGRSSTLL